MIGNLDFFGGIVTLVNATDGSATTYYSRPFDVSGSVSGDVLLDVLGIIGTTPKLDVTLQKSNDMVTWETIGSAFTQKTAIGTENEALSSFYRYIRAKCVVDGDDCVVVFTLRGSTRAS